MLLGGTLSNIASNLSENMLKTQSLLFLIFVSIFFVPTKGISQAEITWKTLSDVTFTDKYSEEGEAYYYYPDFGPSVKALQGKEVFLKGFMLPIDPDKGIYILSRNPFASCFFCGNAGPETIVELKLLPGYPKFGLDQIVTMEGRLKLNRDDIYQCNYILQRAKVYKP